VLRFQPLEDFLFELGDNCVHPFGNEFADRFKREQCDGDTKQRDKNAQYLASRCLRSDPSITWIEKKYKQNKDEMI